MRVVIQRCLEASVSIASEVVSSVQKGMLILVGIEDRDTAEDIEYIVKKVVSLRIFPDEAGVMNRSVMDIDGEILLVSQFTLMASTKKGNRPSYIRASRPEVAVPIYEELGQRLEQALGKSIGRGVFGADMQIALVNDGPVTIIIDSQLKDF